MFGFLNMDIFATNWFDVMEANENEMRDQQPISTPLVKTKPIAEVKSECPFSFQKVSCKQMDTNYSQRCLMNKFNNFFQQKNDTYKLIHLNEAEYKKHEHRLIDLKTEGFCWGLATLWAYERSQGNEEQFYNRIKDIIDCPDERLIHHDAKIMTFFSKIDSLSAQSPSFYSKEQCDTPQDLGLKRLSLTNIEVSQDVKLLKALEKKAPNNEIILVTGLPSRYENNELDTHAVALSRQGNGFLLFDANNPALHAVHVSNNKSLLQRLRYALYKFEGKKIKPKVRLELSIWNSPPELKPSTALSNKGITPVFFKPAEKSKLELTSYTSTMQAGSK